VSGIAGVTLTSRPQAPERGPHREEDAAAAGGERCEPLLERHTRDVGDDHR
jgi:hypothetical protein